MADVAIGAAAEADAADWLRLRAALWPGEEAEHRSAIAAALVRNDPGRTALIARVQGLAVGLAEAAVRHDYVNGCDTSPVAFLEGLYVAPAWRRQGVARALVERVETWGLAAGCREFASDAPIGNEASLLLHHALGFAETERVVFFRKGLAA